MRHLNQSQDNLRAVCVRVCGPEDKNIITEGGLRSKAG